MSKRRIILNLAMSLDGYIADEDGGFAWIMGDGDVSANTDNAFDFANFMQSVDTIVMGRKAYEDCPVETIKEFADKKIYLATHAETINVGTNVTCIKGDVVKQILEEQQKPGKDLWIRGGSHLADAFIKGNVIDVYIVGIIPIILGKGRPLFLDDNPLIELHLTRSTSQEGIVIVEYEKRN